MAERAKMSKEQRAKQFLPFSALKGYEEALRSEEIRHDMIKKPVLAEEAEEEIDRALRMASEGDRVSVSFFKFGHIEEVSGEIRHIDSYTLEIDDVCVSVRDITAVYDGE